MELSFFSKSAVLSQRMTSPPVFFHKIFCIFSKIHFHGFQIHADADVSQPLSVVPAAKLNQFSAALVIIRHVEMAIAVFRRFEQSLFYGTKALGIGLSPLLPKLAIKIPAVVLLTYQSAVEGRNTAVSNLPSPS